MANRYANLVGSNKIKDEYTKINTGFDKVEQEMDAKPDSSIAKVNTVEMDADDTLTIEAGVGIEIVPVPEEKKIRIVATGTSTPGPHGIEHNHDGSDPVPELVEVRINLTAHLAQTATDDVHDLITDGKIIEEVGSNANGNYVRFADGTQICFANHVNDVAVATAEGSLFKSNTDQTWVFPAAFIDASYHFSGINIRSDHSGWVVPVNAALQTATSVTYKILSAVSSAPTTRSSRLIAIGRWK